MIYTDGIHMVATTIDELHAFAASIGCGRHWYEGLRKGHPHYDLIGKYYNLAISKGATQVTGREIVELFKTGKVARK